jgi:hypothetical protein
MEVVLLVAACGRLLEFFVAPLLALPVASVMHFTQTVINIVLIVATVRVLHSWQTRFFAEMLFQAEMSGTTKAGLATLLRWRVSAFADAPQRQAA